MENSTTKKQKTTKQNKEKQFLVRNLVWNKHYTNTNQKPGKIATTLNKELQKDKRIKYSLFTIERGKRQNEQSFHLQGYTEFATPIDAIAFNKEYEFTDIQSRKGSQEQAIDYVKKQKSKISTKEYTFGVPKKQLHKYNVKDKDIPKDTDSQRILLNHRLKDNYYQTFKEIEQDFELMYLKNKTWCKNLWDEYHPIKVLNTKPAETIWIYGHSGIGKTTWTNKYLLKKGYKDGQITKQKASNETRPRLWFSLEDEGRKVLWIEEIRENYPEFNDLIQIIDKGTRLEVKGSQIDNTFELIILNSLYSPEYIYRKLRFGHQVEILRRLYRGNNSKVYQLLPNEENYNELVDKTDELPKTLKEHYKHSELELEKQKLLKQLETCTLKELKTLLEEYTDKTRTLIRDDCSDSTIKRSEELEDIIRNHIKKIETTEFWNR